MLFQNRLELFTDVPGAGTPDISDPAILRGRYIQVFTDLLFEEETIVFNLFDDVSITFVREKLDDSGYQPYESDLLKSYSWIGGPSEEGWDGAVITFSKDGDVYGGVLFEGHEYLIEGQEGGLLAIFEIDLTAPIPVLDIDAEELRQSRSTGAPQSLT